MSTKEVIGLDLIAQRVGVCENQLGWIAVLLLGHIIVEYIHVQFR